jgi:hypothetical protein
MKKSKKNTPRPRWHCDKCGLLWVSCEPDCIICGVRATPLSDSADKIIEKRRKST